MATKNKVLVRGDFAAVEWIDACSQDAWEEGSEIDLKPAPVLTVGQVFAHDKESITLALNHDPENDSFSCLMVIGRGMIKDIRKLEYAKTKTVQTKPRIRKQPKI